MKNTEETEKRNECQGDQSVAEDGFSSGMAHYNESESQMGTNAVAK
jgi:hypothetical protein